MCKPFFRRFLPFWIVSLIIVIFQSTLANEQEQEPSTANLYPVSQFVLFYGNEHPELPFLESLAKLKIEMGLEEGVYVPPESSDQKEEITLGSLDLNESSAALFSVDGLQYVLTMVADYWKKEDYYGSYAMFDPSQIDPRTVQDLRKNGDTSLNLISWLSQISLVQPIDAETNKPIDPLEDKTRYSKFMGSFPADLNQEGGSVLLQRTVLENYLRRLNRHPGRQVNATVSPSKDLGKVAMDLMISERKPYILYSQISNNGTDTTGEWRGRLGFIDYQFSERDDIFSFDYITSGLQKSNALLASHQIPLIRPNYLSMRTYGSWSEYRADEVGVSVVDFQGKSTNLGLEFIISPLQVRDYYLDLLMGMSLSQIEVDNETFDQIGKAKTLIPYLGASLGRNNFLRGFHLGVTTETNTHPISEDDQTNLGRLRTEDNWFLAKVNGRAHAYLEPLLFPSAWRDASSWRSSTLAHEVSFRVQGQYVFDSTRVIPQENLIMGGATTVRGYPESTAAGDNGFFVSGQYRFHFPRILKPAAMKENAKQGARPSWLKWLDGYNLRPSQVYSQPDWDLMLRLFTDYAETRVNEKDSSENNHILFSSGVGLELQLLSNINMSLDWGYVLKSLERNTVPVDDAQEGDNRFHFMFTGSW